MALVLALALVMPLHVLLVMTVLAPALVLAMLLGQISVMMALALALVLVTRPFLAHGRRSDCCALLSCLGAREDPQLNVVAVACRAHEQVHQGHPGTKLLPGATAALNHRSESRTRQRARQGFLKRRVRWRCVISGWPHCAV